MEKKAREEMAPEKKKVIAFKSTRTISDDDDEEFSLLVKNIRRMYNKAKFNNRRRWQGKEDKKVICFNCRKLGHMVMDCSEIKSKPSNLQEALEALKATWNSESETDEEVNTTHVCFMTNDNTSKVTSEPSLDDCELKMDELGEAFEELSNNYDFLKKKYLKIKKENEKLLFFLKKKIYPLHSYPHKKI